MINTICNLFLGKKKTLPHTHASSVRTELVDEKPCDAVDRVHTEYVEAKLLMLIVCLPPLPACMTQQARGLSVPRNPDQ